jgi:DNA-binding beta-propeller fold protein YncE
MKSWKLLLLIALSLALATATPARAADAPASPGYHFVKEIHIGGDGGWDYLSADAAARRLYVAHGSNVVVLDLDAETVVGQITNTPGVHGFVAVPKYKVGFSSNGREGRLSLVDLKTLKTKSRIKAGRNPDAILYDSGSDQVYAFNGGDNSVTIVESDDGDSVTTTALPGKPEFATADPGAGRVYCNLEDQSAVAVIDTVSHTVIHTWPLAPGKGPSGMALDAAHHRLFVGCGGNNLMVMMDSTSGKVLATVPIGAGVDANAFDPGTQLAFSSNGEGNVTIAHVESPGSMTVVQTLATQRGARTMALDTKTHKIYLAVADLQPAPAAPAGAPPARPQPVPGTFRILVYGM